MLWLIISDCSPQSHTPALCLSVTVNMLDNCSACFTAQCTVQVHLTMKNDKNIVSPNISASRSNSWGHIYVAAMLSLISCSSFFLSDCNRICFRYWSVSGEKGWSSNILTSCLEADPVCSRNAKSVSYLVCTAKINVYKPSRLFFFSRHRVRQCSNQNCFWIPNRFTFTSGALRHLL